MIKRTLFAACSSAWLLAAPARLSGQGNPPSWSNIRSTLRIGANEGDQIVWVSNHSDQAIIVNGVTLADCENVRVSCSTHRLNIRIHPGQEKMIYRVRQRFADQRFHFRYSFSWVGENPVPVAPGERAAVAVPVEEAGRIENPAVRDLVEEAVKADSVSSRVADTVEVIPTQLNLRVGQRVNLLDTLRVVARSSDGQAIAGLKLKTAIEVGRESVRIEGGSLVGLKPGTAVLLISPPLPPGATGEPKGAARIVIRVLP